MQGCYVSRSGEASFGVRLLSGDSGFNFLFLSNSESQARDGGSCAHNACLKMKNP